VRTITSCAARVRSGPVAGPGAGNHAACAHPRQPSGLVQTRRLLRGCVRPNMTVLTGLAARALRPSRALRRVSCVYCVLYGYRVYICVYVPSVSGLEGV
jgi:hypothetical protein